MDQCGGYHPYGNTIHEDQQTNWLDTQQWFGAYDGQDLFGNPTGTEERETRSGFKEDPQFPEDTVSLWQQSDQEVQRKIEDEILTLRDKVTSILAEQRIHCEYLFGMNPPEVSSSPEKFVGGCNLRLVPQGEEMPGAVSSADSMSEGSLLTYYEPTDQSLESEENSRNVEKYDGCNELDRLALRTLTLAVQIYGRLSQLYFAT